MSVLLGSEVSLAVGATSVSDRFQARESDYDSQTGNCVSRRFGILAAAC